MPLSLAAATLGASIIGAGASIFGSDQSARAAKEATEAQIAWERERARNAHQWEVEDLKKAGLNPILSAGGSGAVTGGISAPVPDTSGYGEAGRTIAEGVKTAAEVGFRNKEVEAAVDKILSDISLQDEQKGLIKAQTLRELEQAKLITKQQAQTAADAMLKTEQSHFTYTQNKQMILEMQTRLEILKQQLKGAKTDNEKKRLEYSIARYTAAIEKASEIIKNNATSASALLNAGANVVDAVIPL